MKYWLSIVSAGDVVRMTEINSDRIPGVGEEIVLDYQGYSVCVVKNVFTSACTSTPQTIVEAFWKTDITPERRGLMMRYGTKNVLINEQ